MCQVEICHGKLFQNGNPLMIRSRANQMLTPPPKERDREREQKKKQRNKLAYMHARAHAYVLTHTHTLGGCEENGLMNSWDKR